MNPSVRPRPSLEEQIASVRNPHPSGSLRELVAQHFAAANRHVLTPITVVSYLHVDIDISSSETIYGEEPDKEVTVEFKYTVSDETPVHVGKVTYKTDSKEYRDVQKALVAALNSTLR